MRWQVQHFRESLCDRRDLARMHGQLGDFLEVGLEQFLRDDLPVDAPGGDPHRGLYRLLDLPQEDLQRAVRLCFRRSFEGDRQHETFNGLGIHRRAQDRADSSRGHGHDLHAERIDQARLHRGQPVVHPFQPRLQMSVQHLLRIVHDRRDGDDRLRIVQMAESGE